MAQFGTVEHARYLPELRAVNHYERRVNSPGYDSQWYAQIAMHPYLRGSPAEEGRGQSSVTGRAGYSLCGRHGSWAVEIRSRALNVYAAQKVFGWFILRRPLAALVSPTNWGNCFRWAAVLYSFGLIFSVTSALLDGPSLLLTVVAMILISQDGLGWRPWSWGFPGSVRIRAFSAAPRCAHRSAQAADVGALAGTGGPRPSSRCGMDALPEALARERRRHRAPQFRPAVCGPHEQARGCTLEHLGRRLPELGRHENRAPWS